MPDLSHFMRNTPADEVEELVVPEGYWKGVIKSGQLDDKDRDGEPRINKHGDEFVMITLYVQCNEPVDGVDSAAAAAYLDVDGPNQTLARYSQYVPIDRWRREVKKMTTTLAACGVPTANRSIDKILDELKGAETPIQVLVEHETYNDELQANVTELAAAVS